MRLTAFAHAAPNEILLAQSECARAEHVLITQILELSDDGQRVAEKLVLDDRALSDAGLLREGSGGENLAVVLDDDFAAFQFANVHQFAACVLDTKRLRVDYIEHKARTRRVLRENALTVTFPKSITTGHERFELTLRVEPPESGENDPRR